MGDSFYPTVDLDFIIDHVLKSGKVIPESKNKIGNTVSFLLEGNQAIHKRLIIIRHINSEINFEQASSLAFNFGFMGFLLNWLIENKGWKEGGYSVESINNGKSIDK